MTQMSMGTAKEKIKDLNTIVKRFKEDCEQKGVIIKSQEETIQSHQAFNNSLKMENKDLQEALFIKDTELVDSEKVHKSNIENYEMRLIQIKSRIELSKQLNDDALAERSY